jgi:NADPH-dependent 2,4-dienoyl-CoA reductase/sulfur reductase-like enzyme
MTDITHSYAALTGKHGVRHIRESAVAIDTSAKTVRTSGGNVVRYDRLVLSPGIDIRFGALEGYTQAAVERMPHAWQAGTQTVLLRRQLEAMPDGGTFVMSIPSNPFRCPPGPYERACQVAEYFSKAKPKSKVLILDANDDVTSKGPLFKKAWKDRYEGIVEYRPKHKVVDVDATTNTLKFEFSDDVKAAVLNVIPEMNFEIIIRFVRIFHIR